MTVKNLKYTFTQLGYSDITSNFIEIPNIAYITLTTNGTIFRETEGTCKYYLDTTNGLFYQTKFRNGQELGISAIVPVSEIISVVARTPYSASMFVGNVY